MDTHPVPAALGGHDGGGLVLGFGDSLDNPNGAVTQLVNWVTLRLALYKIRPDEKTSLLSMYID